jgi:hypothetical protein
MNRDAGSEKPQRRSVTVRMLRQPCAWKLRR